MKRYVLGTRRAHRVLAGKLKEKKALGRPRITRVALKEWNG